MSVILEMTRPEVPPDALLIGQDIVTVESALAEAIRVCRPDAREYLDCIPFIYEQPHDRIAACFTAIALDLGVSGDRLEELAENHGQGSVEQVSGIAAEIEFVRGNGSQHIRNSIEVRSVPQSVAILLSDNIKPPSDEDGASVSNYRGRIKNELIKAGVTDENDIFAAQVVSTELITNVKREHPLGGGDYYLGLDESCMYAIADNNPNPPSGVSLARMVGVYAAQRTDDPGESGRGFVVSRGYGTPYQEALDTPEGPRYIRFWCAIPLTTTVECPYTGPSTT